MGCGLGVGEGFLTCAPPRPLSGLQFAGQERSVSGVEAGRQAEVAPPQLPVLDKAYARCSELISASFPIPEA